MTQTTVLQDSAPGPAGQLPAVRLAGVTKSFGPVEAVSGIDLRIHAGEGNVAAYIMVSMALDCAVVPGQ